MAPSPEIKHQDIIRNIVEELCAYVDKSREGIIYFAPTDVFLDEFNVVQPDILFISNKRLNIITEKYIKGAPDLVVEVISKSTRQNDLIVKKELYQRFGVKEYWIVDPAYETVDVYTLKNNIYNLYKSFNKNDTLSSKVLKNIKIELKKVFP